MDDTYSNKIRKIKREILTACYNTKEGHIASSFSILDILYVLYNDVMNISIDNLNDPCRDRFVLSKGHASIGLYAILRDKGFFEDSLDTFGKFGSILGGHPDCNKIPGIEASTGSLGHGAPMAVGMALGLKIQKNPAHVYTLVGDGEINEGSVWEGLLIAKHHNLNNFTIIVDYNHSTDRAVDISDIDSKMKSFGFDSFIVDGHAPEALREALRMRGEKPTAIIAETIKGNGIKDMEDNPAWHHRMPTEEEYGRFMEELS